MGAYFQHQIQKPGNKTIQQHKYDGGIKFLEWCYFENTAVIELINFIIKEGPLNIWTVCDYDDEVETEQSIQPWMSYGHSISILPKVKQSSISHYLKQFETVLLVCDETKTFIDLNQIDKLKQDWLISPLNMLTRLAPLYMGGGDYYFNDEDISETQKELVGSWYGKTIYAITLKNEQYSRVLNEYKNISDQMMIYE